MSTVESNSKVTSPAPVLGDQKANGAKGTVAYVSLPSETSSSSSKVPAQVSPTDKPQEELRKSNSTSSTPAATKPSLKKKPVVAEPDPKPSESVEKPKPREGDQAAAPSLIEDDDEEWKAFTSEVAALYAQTKEIKTGKVADYIPQLAKANPDHYAISVCSVEGKQFSIGDADKDFCVQSVSKPITYCIALEQMGENEVHKHVGREPSGRGFNAYKLSHSRVPFNPLINSGAISTAALVSPQDPMSERFELVKKYWERLSGHGKIKFDNSTYQSEKKTADRNFALGYLLKENGVFAPDADLKDTLDLYFQCCSIEVTAKTMAVVAATLANGGVCPLTNENVKNCLSLMHLCGMYDYSGEFAFTVGLPAKSGVAGALMIVVPGVLGIATWSPPLDHHGNSVRGLAFCRALSQSYDFHAFSGRFASTSADNLHVSSRKDEKTSEVSTEVSLINLCYAAGHGDVAKVKKILEQTKIDINLGDYDGRTALHIAASEGQAKVVQFLLEHKASPAQKDRWGGTPLSDAERGRHHEVVKLLLQAGAARQEFRGTK